MTTCNKHFCMLANDSFGAICICGPLFHQQWKETQVSPFSNYHSIHRPQGHEYKWTWSQRCYTLGPAASTCTASHLRTFTACFSLYFKLTTWSEFGQTESCISSVGIATGYRLENRGVGVRVPVGSRIVLHVAQTGSGAHPASYPMGTRSSFPGGKAAGA
jgi:hypothetical protein